MNDLLFNFSLEYIFPYNLTQITLYDTLIYFASAFILAVIGCFLILATLLTLNKSIVFNEDEWTIRGLFKYARPCFVFIWFTQFGINIFIRLMNPDAPLLIYLWSPVLIFGILVASRALVKIGQKKYAQALMYGILCWSIVTLIIALYANPSHFRYFVIPSTILSLIVTPFSFFVEYFAILIKNIKEKRF